jgi:hypothetical protein
MLKNKKFEGYILRNRIVGVVVSLILVSVMIYMACHFSLIDRMNTRTYRTLADIENIDNLGENDVSITIERADYLGYDYYEESERIGRYYYCQQDGRYAILLLTSSDEVVLNYTVRGRLISGSSEYDDILDGLAQDIGISRRQIECRIYPHIISEVDFPRIYYNMMLLVLVLSVLWAVYCVAHCIYNLVCPWKTARLRSALGSRTDRNTIRDIDNQLRYNLYYDQDGVAITDSYFVYHGMWHTDVVRLDSIETFKKLRTSSNIGVGSKRIYKLIMVDVDGVTYEQNFKSEASLDEALSYLGDKNKI